MRLEPRAQTDSHARFAAPVAAVVASAILCGGLIAWCGAPVLGAYWAMIKGALGNTLAITETLARATPLIFTGLSAACAFRARFWNIGEEGQLYFGAVAATVVGRGVVDLPPILMIPFLMLVGALAAGLLLLLIAWLKSRFGVEEVVTSLLSNFLVVLLISMLLDHVLKDPMSLGWPQSEPIIDSGQLPKLVAGTRLHAGFIIALLAAAAIWVYDRYTTFGYEARAVGHNRAAAAFAGIPVRRTILRVALLSGGLAGLAGVSEVAGFRGNLTLELSPGFGYTGIVVAMLAQLNAIGVVASAILIAGIFIGADAMSRVVHVPTYIADVFGSTTLLLMLLALMLTRYRLRWS